MEPGEVKSKGDEENGGKENENRVEGDKLKIEFDVKTVQVIQDTENLNDRKDVEHNNEKHKTETKQIEYAEAITPNVSTQDDTHNQRHEDKPVPHSELLTGNRHTEVSSVQSSDNINVSKMNSPPNYYPSQVNEESHMGWLDPSTSYSQGTPLLQGNPPTRATSSYMSGQSTATFPRWETEYTNYHQPDQKPGTPNTRTGKREPIPPRSRRRSLPSSNHPYSVTLQPPPPPTPQQPSLLSPLYPIMMGHLQYHESSSRVYRRWLDLHQASSSPSCSSHDKYFSPPLPPQSPPPPPPGTDDVIVISDSDDE